MDHRPVTQPLFLQQPEMRVVQISSCATGIEVARRPPGATGALSEHWLVVMQPHQTKPAKVTTIGGLSQWHQPVEMVEATGWVLGRGRKVGRQASEVNLCLSGLASLCDIDSPPGQQCAPKLLTALMLLKWQPCSNAYYWGGTKKCGSL